MKERLSVFYFILICFLIYGCASLSNQHQNQPPIQPENQPEKQSSSELQQTFSAPMETEGDRALVDPNKLRFDLLLSATNSLHLDSIYSMKRA